MIDVSGDLALWLRDGDVDAYADELPNAVAYPAVLVRPGEVVPVTPGVPGWHDYTLQVDVIGASRAYADTVTLVEQVADRVRLFPGGAGTALVGPDVTAVRSAPDDSLSPAHPRWVLSVALTARSTPQGQGETS
jgi:hypothetical protein